MVEEKIEFNLNYITVLISFTFNFILVNLINVTYFYKGILPYIENKIKNIMNFKVKKYYKFDEKYTENIKKSNKLYYTETIKFYLILVLILILINFYIYSTNSIKYKLNLTEFFTFTNMKNSTCMILFSLLVQFIYYTGFAFKYYLYIINKYIFEILRLN